MNFFKKIFTLKLYHRLKIYSTYVFFAPCPSRISIAISKIAPIFSILSSRWSVVRISYTAGSN